MAYSGTRKAYQTVSSWLGTRSWQRLPVSMILDFKRLSQDCDECEAGIHSQKIKYWFKCSQNRSNHSYSWRSNSCSIKVNFELNGSFSAYKYLTSKNKRAVFPPGLGLDSSWILGINEPDPRTNRGGFWKNAGEFRDSTIYIPGWWILEKSDWMSEESNDPHPMISPDGF